MARELGEMQKAKEFEQWAARIYAAYNRHLLVTDDASRPYAYYTSLDNYPARDRDAIAQAMALQFGLVPEQHRKDVMAAFLDDVADGRIRAGEIGLRFLFNTLADAKRPDLVLQMARQEEHPSYMRFLRRGETTLLEFWQDECRSKCHDMLGTIYEWFYAAVLGLKPTGPAYRTFVVDPPYNAEFKHVKGSVDCPYGTIAVEFMRNEQGQAVVNVRVPFGTTAIVKLPRSGKSSAYCREGEESRAVDGGEVSLSHGVYSIIEG